MPLSAGTRLGHYDVTALLGEGGMGQVWQATDTQLNRQVALKILPDAFAADPDRLARFKREAQILASLNHPNIAAIYGIEQAEGTRALVLELVEGPTLAERIKQGPIPVDEALPIAKQIAEALEAAHEAGVIHRDLKPANIKVREDGTVKVLDFGLAKALDPSPDADPSQSPTLTAAATQMGVIMGTAAYMSPEQATGQTADKRSDVWSFGVILFEMLTGQRLFTGETVSHVLASVLKTDPSWALLPADTPAAIQRLLKRSLERERKRRLPDVSVALLEIEEAASAPAQSESVGEALTPRVGWRQAGILVLGTLVVGSIVTGVAVWMLVRPPALPVSRFTIVPPQGVQPTLPRLSPDGRTLAFTGVGGTVSRNLECSSSPMRRGSAFMSATCRRERASGTRLSTGSSAISPRTGAAPRCRRSRRSLTGSATRGRQRAYGSTRTSTRASTPLAPRSPTHRWTHSRWSPIASMASGTTRCSLDEVGNFILIKVLTGVGGTVSQVYVQTLDQLEAVALQGAEGATVVDFAPDGQSLLIMEAGPAGVTPLAATVMRVPVTGGTPTRIGSGMGLSAWGRDDTFVLGGLFGLRLVRASGGEETRLTTVGEEQITHFVTTFLPHGRAVLFYSFGGRDPSVAVYDFETGEGTDLIPGTSPMFVPSGHLVFWRDGSLWAVPFDPDRLEVRGDPVLVVDGVQSFSSGVAAYTVADNGTLVYLPAEATTSTVGWVNREGAMTTPLFEGQGLAWPALSPDGTRVAFQRPARPDGEDVWIRDLSNELETKLTETSGFNQWPIWMPDGQTVTFASDLLSGGFHPHARPVDLSRDTQLLTRTGIISAPGSWTPDGQTLVYHAGFADSYGDIWTLTVGADPMEFFSTDFNELHPRLSPNGKWLAYVSDRTGENRVYVQAFPEGGAIQPISTGPGSQALWSRTGRELFYRNGDQLWAVEVETEPGFTAETPTLLFEAPYAAGTLGLGYPSYDVSLDGQQFLMVREDSPSETRGYVMVQNWHEELKRLVPLN